MGFEDDDYDRWLDGIDDYDAQIVERGIEERTYDNVRDYLGRHGDAVQERVDRCLSSARDLLDKGHPAFSIVCVGTAFELIVRYFLVRPLLEGAFLAEPWAEVVLGRLLKSRSADDRRLLPAVLRPWGIDLNAITLPDGSPLWKDFHERLLSKRNDIVHQAETATADEAERALLSVRIFNEEIVKPLAFRIGLSWPESGAWHVVEQGVGGAKFTTTYDKADPFVRSSKRKSAV